MIIFLDKYNYIIKKRQKFILYKDLFLMKDENYSIIKSGLL